MDPHHLCTYIHKYYRTFDSVSRIRDLSGQVKKVEDGIDSLKKELTSSLNTNQALIDEHQALQLAYNSYDKKLKELEVENDRLVSTQQSGFLIVNYTPFTLSCHRTLH